MFEFQVTTSVLLECLWSWGELYILLSHYNSHYTNAIPSVPILFAIRLEDISFVYRQLDQSKWTELIKHLQRSGHAPELHLLVSFHFVAFGFQLFEYHSGFSFQRNVLFCRRGCMCRKWKRFSCLEVKIQNSKQRAFKTSCRMSVTSWLREMEAKHLPRGMDR